jgi:ABC-2 type transport system ATP-binding protein
MAEVTRLCDRVVFLAEGRIVADGTPAEVSRRFGRSDLEGVFLHLAEDRRPDQEPPANQQTDHAL